MPGLAWSPDEAKPLTNGQRKHGRKHGRTQKSEAVKGVVIYAILITVAS